MDKIEMVRLGVEIGVWAPPLSDPINTEPAVLSVGSLQEKKGHDYLIQAIALLRERDLHPRCLIVGEGHWRSILEHRVSTLNLTEKVVLPGALPSDIVRRHCQGADVFVLASVNSTTEGSDGIPVALMEAMALGRACVSTDVAGIPELITDEVNGLLVHERDPAALADAIARLLSDAELRARLGRGAREKIEADFDLERNLRRLDQLLRSSLRTSGRQ